MVSEFEKIINEQIALGRNRCVMYYSDCNRISLHCAFDLSEIDFDNHELVVSERGYEIFVKFKSLNTLCKIKDGCKLSGNTIQLIIQFY